ncbi:MAG: hypothetical protein Q8Q09_27735 [Deltaproteobacteria bacterium]|nr:hypothetical protein [Deltaproteobacteria bacterium]
MDDDARNETIRRGLSTHVPEIAQGIVVIHKIVSGQNRSKIAVRSTKPTVDPVKTCAAHGAAAIHALQQQLGCTMDLVAWGANWSDNIRSSLLPLKCTGIDPGEFEGDPVKIEGPYMQYDEGHQLSEREAMVATILSLARTLTGEELIFSTPVRWLLAPAPRG